MSTENVLTINWHIILDTCPLNGSIINPSVWQLAQRRISDCIIDLIPSSLTIDATIIYFLLLSLTSKLIVKFRSLMISYNRVEIWTEQEETKSEMINVSDMET